MLDNTVQSIDWFAISPAVVMACTAVVVLLADAFAGPPRSRAQALVPATLTVLGIVGATVPAALLWGERRATFCIVEPFGGVAPCSFVVDPFTLVFWGVVLFGTAVVALLGTAEVADGRTPQG